MKYEIAIETKDEKTGDTKVSGTVSIEVPLHHIRMANVAAIGGHKLKGTDGVKKPKGGKNAKEDENDKEILSSYEHNMPILSKAYGFARESIKEVDLKSKSGAECKSLEEMEANNEFQGVWPVIAIQYIQGFGPGKSKG